MPHLTTTELRSRRALDYRATLGLSRETLGEISAYASVADIGRARRVSPQRGEAGDAAVYVVEYKFTHLVGRGVTAAAATAVFDSTTTSNYPFTPPAVTFISRPLPWSPHVHPGNGLVCLGSGWQDSGGRMLLAQLVVHVMRLVNFDEPRTSADGRWNASADAYWHSTLHRRPYLPELRYPRLPAEITHGLGDETSVFRAAGRNEEGADVMFRPAR